MDIDTVFALGVNGLAELTALNAKFGSYEKTLFNPNMKTMERTLQTKEENAQLDKTIASFLQQLSPYFLVKPAHKALEWLIRRFRVTDMNVEDILRCVLPYHETNLFARMVQLLSTQNHPRWAFLAQTKKNAAPLARQTLVHRCLEDSSVLRFILTTVKSSVEAGVTSQTMLAFYTATLTTLLRGLNHVGEGLLNEILPTLANGLRAKARPQYQLASYMIAAQLCVRARLSQSVGEALLTASAAAAPTNHHEALLFYVVFCQTQMPTALPEAIITELVSWASLVDDLASVGQQTDISPLLALLLPARLHASAEAADSLTVVIQCVRQLPLSSSSVAALLAVLVKDVLSDHFSAEWVSSDAARALLTACNLRHSAQVDATIDAALKSLPSGNDEKAAAGQRLLDLISQTFKGTQHQPVVGAKTTLFLSSQHAQASVRAMAVAAVADALEDADADLDFLASVVLARVSDEDATVAKAALALLEENANLTAATDAAELLRVLVLRASVTNMDKAARSIASRALTVLAGAYLTAHPDAVSTVAPVVLSMVCSAHSKVASRAAEAIADGSPLAKSGLLRGVAKACAAHADADYSTRLTAIVEVVGRNISGNRALFDELVESLPQSSGAVRSSLLIVLANSLTAVADATERLDRSAALLGSIEATVPLESLVTVRDAQFKTIADLLSDAERRVIPTSHAQLHVLATIISATEPELFSKIVCSDSVVASASEAQYRDLLNSLFVACACSGGAGPASKVLLTDLFTAHLARNEVAFLLHIASSDDNSVVVQAAALHMLAAWLRAAAINKIARNPLAILPMLFASLGSQSKIVRAAALACFESALPLFAAGADAVDATPKKRNGASSLDEISFGALYGAPSEVSVSPAHARSFVTLVCSRGEEFLSDCTFGRIFFSTAASDAKGRDATEEREAFVRLVAHAAAHIDKPHSQLRLLAALSGSSSTRRTSLILPLLTRLVRQAASTGAMAPHTSDLIEGVFKITGGRGARRLSTEDEAELIAVLESAKGTAVVLPAVLRSLPTSIADLLSEGGQARLLALLLDVLQGANEAASPFARDFLQATSLPMSLYIAEIAGVATGLQAPRAPGTASKKSKKESAAPVVTSEAASAASLARLTAILESLEVKERQAGSADLIPVLFDTLHLLLPAASGASEYLKQLTLSYILAVTQAERDANTHMPERSFRVDVLVQCIRGSENPQTHQLSLLLMGAIASLYPDSVLTHIMSVFTFMGANVLRQDDNYSFHVIQQTLEKVIPPLLARHTVRSVVHVDIKPVLKVFVDALFHIPKHRRLRLFTVLVNTLGERQYLYAVLAVLLEKAVELYPNASELDKNSDDPDSIEAFCVSISNQFAAEVELGQLVQLVQLVTELPHDKPEKSDAYADAAEDTSLFNVLEHTPKQLRAFKMGAIRLVSSILTSRPLLQKVVARESQQQSGGLESGFMALLEATLALVSSVGAQLTKSADEVGGATVVKYWRILSRQLHDVIDQINGLLSIPAFVGVIARLIKHKSSTIRRKALVLFNERLIAHRADLSRDETALFVQMVGDITPLLSAAAAADDSETAVNQQTALLSLEILSRSFAKRESAVFFSTVPVVMAAAQHPNTQVSATALVCLATLCAELGPQMLGHLPKIVSISLDASRATLGNATQQSDLPEPKQLFMLSALTLSQELLVALPQFMSPYLPALLAVSLHAAMPVDAATGGQLGKKNATVLDLIGQKCAPRVVIPAITAYFGDCKAAPRSHAVVPLFELAGRIASRLDRPAVTAHHAELFDLFIGGLELRSAQLIPADEVDATEDAVTDAVVQLVVKMNETLFRPMLLRVVTWATGEEKTPRRLITFFRLTNKVAEQLKSIFVPFFAMFFTNVVDEFGAVASYVAPTASSASTKKGKRSRAQADAEQANAQLLNAAEAELLWTSMLATIHRVMVHDTEHFFDRERFDAIMQPLVDQLESPLAGDGEQRYPNLCAHVVPVLGQLAVTVSNDSMWKSLNHQTLLLTRSGQSDVRRGALRCLQEYYTRLGEEFLILLPETIPFLAEVLEDAEHDVEQLAHEVVAQIEKVLGEPLKKYFA